MGVVVEIGRDQLLLGPSEDAGEPVGFGRILYRLVDFLDVGLATRGELERVLGKRGNYRPAFTASLERW